MGTPTGRGGPLVFIDMDREKRYWRGIYQTLPGANEEPSYEMYWPVLAVVYDIYINHPGCDCAQARALFAESLVVRSRAFSAAERDYLFSRVWERISGEAGPRRGP